MQRVEPTPWTRAGRERSERRPSLAPLAPHQPPPARHAAHALERGGVAAGQGRVHEGPRAEESDPARGVVQLIVTDAPADVESDRVWMTCSCVAVLVPVMAFS